MELICAKKVDERVYEVHIGGHIGNQVNGAYIEADIKFINKSNKADRINVHINSEGGSVINGIKVISGILNSKIPIHTYNDGYAMSMAGFIWLSAKKENRHMAQFARFMIHAPRFVSKEGNLIQPATEDEKRGLEITESQLAYITKESTGLSDNEVAKILSKDSYYTAEECHKAGFLPKANIIEYSKMPQFTESINENIQRIAAFYNNNQNQTNMKQVAAYLKLNSEASETAILDRIQAIEKEKNDAVAESRTLQENHNKELKAVQDLEKKVKGYETKIKDYETKEAEANKRAATTEVEAAIKEGHFKAEAKDKLIELAVKDPEAFKTMKESIKFTVEAPDISSQLTGGLDSQPIDTLAAKYGVEAKDFNYDFLWKNAPDKLKAMEKDDAKVYQLLQAKYIQENQG